MRDPVELEVFKNLYHSIAEEMGAALRRTSFSPNIKERRDYSCAVFDSAGQVIAMGDHMPVHLGSMPMSVAAAVEHCDLEPGDVVMLNDPFRGGTHLPDITLVMPVYDASDSKSIRSRGDGAKPALSRAEGPRPHRAAPDFYVASRAHHADVGGTYPGSMGPCREIYQEGLRIPPVKIMREENLLPMCWPSCSTMSARPKNAKATWAHKSPPARPEPSAFGMFVLATELCASSEPQPI